MDFFGIARVLLSGAWSFFTGLEVPGLQGVTFASVFVAFFLGVLGIRLVSFALGVFSSNESPRTSSTRRPKISEKRKGDEF